MNRLIAALVLVCAASAQAENLAFKHYTLGMPYSELQALPELACRETNAPIADQMCILRPTHKETIAGARVQAIMLLIYDGLLGTISVQIAEQDFRQVAIALQTKYGDGQHTESLLQNRMGAQFKSLNIKWEMADQYINAEQRSGKIDRSSIIFSLKSAQEAYKSRIPASRATNANDL